jgi:dTDP-4-dehydrorhamnose 3,5-epimerase
LNCIKTEIPGVLIFEPKIFGDQRGYFLESFRLSWLEENGIKTRFIQDNISRSKKGTLRGMHYQLHNPQAKLVMVTSGEVLDIAVDVRKDSPTFGKSVSCLLTEENRRVMYIPEGFAHGFQVISDTADFMYKCSNYYDPTAERGINALDPTLNLPWYDIEPIRSDRDKNLPVLINLPDEDKPKYYNQDI